MSILLKPALEKLIQSHYTEIVDLQQLVKFVLENIRNETYMVLTQKEMPKSSMKFSITKVNLLDSLMLELWVEFTVPKGKNLLIGTQVLHLNFEGEALVKESYGTEFQPEI